MTLDRLQREPPATRASDRYDPSAIERHWQAVWSRTQIYATDLAHAKRPFYNLMMFPYPSAEGLHVGNLYAIPGADIFGRFQAMQGHQVFEPMGFDAFGIHSENYAIKRGIHPRLLTAENVQRFRETQLKRAGCRFDWRHEVVTTDPQYYRWTQWIFVQLFKAGLAERRKALVNWCPTDGTVLADEQVIDGRCERCDTPVELRELEQWFLRITAFADRLLANLDHLDWSENVKTAQRRGSGGRKDSSSVCRAGGRPTCRSTCSRPPRNRLRCDLRRTGAGASAGGTCDDARVLCRSRGLPHAHPQPVGAGAAASRPRQERRVHRRLRRQSSQRRASADLDR